MEAVAPPPVDVDAAVAQMAAALTVRPDGDGFVGDAPSWFGDLLFGGFILGQGVYAASRTASEGRRIHSLHTYFMRPVLAGTPVRYAVSPVRDGRAFSLRRLDASQDGKPVFTMACSFTADVDGYDYDQYKASDAPDPDDIDPTIGPTDWAAPWLRTWQQAWLGPTPPEPDGTRRSTSRVWLRVARALPDDPHLHAAFVAFVSDMTGTGGRPLHLDGDTTGMTSVDHAVWFHRPARADEWLLYDVHALVNAGGRGLLRGTIHRRDRSIAASVAQELVVLPAE